MEMYGTESSGIDTSPDMNTSAEMESPAQHPHHHHHHQDYYRQQSLIMNQQQDRLFTVQPRKLFATPPPSSRSGSLPYGINNDHKKIPITNNNNNNTNRMPLKQQIPNITIDSCSTTTDSRSSLISINLFKTIPTNNNNNNNAVGGAEDELSITPKKYKSNDSSPPYRGVKGLTINDMIKQPKYLTEQALEEYLRTNNNNNNNDRRYDFEAMVEMGDDRDFKSDFKKILLKGMMRKANVNPYTPDNQIHRKRVRTSMPILQQQSTDFGGNDSFRIKKAFDKNNTENINNNNNNNSRSCRRPDDTESPNHGGRSRLRHRESFLKPKSLFKNNPFINNNNNNISDNNNNNNESENCIDMVNGRLSELDDVPWLDELTDTTTTMTGNSHVEEEPPKRLPLHETNISRFEKEFNELETIGEGETGIVYQCKNRLDGCIYAIKKSKKQVAGSSYEKIALNEVFGHAALGKHDNVVRYYSAWSENNYVYIQNEYCNGGSLQDRIQKRPLNEFELKILLLHCAEGLKYIHSHDLVHMDIKPANIFLTKIPCIRDDGFNDGTDGDDDDLVDDADYDDDNGIDDGMENNHQKIIYKIGDLGHVTSQSNPNGEEGDCRYLPQEILDEDFSNLAKADVFALGMTLYEAGGGAPLPKHGPAWHDLREGHVPDLITVSRKFNDLIKLMTHPDPNKRPSTTSLCDHPLLWSTSESNRTTSKSKAQLTLELEMERKKNGNLMKKLKDAKQLLKSYQLSKTPPVHKRPRNSPIVSGRRLRSHSRKKQRKILITSPTLSLIAAAKAATTTTKAAAATTTRITISNSSNTNNNNRKNIRDRNRTNSIEDFDSLP